MGKVLKNAPSKKYKKPSGDYRDNNEAKTKGGGKMSKTPPNGPAKTGRPSGPRRGNNPPRG